MCVIFRDIKNRATAHYQCIPKRHIKNYMWLRLSEEVGGGKPSPDLQLLRHMEQAGSAFLRERHPEKSENEFRMGFHGPRHNSQHHMHLHLIVTPFLGSAMSQIKWGTVVYGELLIPITHILNNYKSL